jgi:hypothetical protein
MRSMRSRKNKRMPLYIAGAVVVALLAGIFWLGQQAGKTKPPEGEVRIPVEGGL